MHPEHSGLVFQMPGSSRLPFYYRPLFEAGIVWRLMTETESRRNLGRKRRGHYTDRIDKMTMDGCIATLFIICTALAGVSGLVFIWECKRILLNSSRLIFKACVTSCRMYCRKTKSRNAIKPFLKG